MPCCQTISLPVALIAILTIVLVSTALGQDANDNGSSNQVEQITKETLRVATREVPPFAMLDEQGNWSGITISLLDEVQAEIEDKANCQNVVDFELIDMGLDEMFEAVEKSEVDLAAAAITVNFDREKRFDFSHPYYSSGLGIAVALGDQQVGFVDLVLSILSPTFLKILAGLLVTMLVVAFLLYFFERRANRDDFGGGAVRGIASGVWWSAVTLTTVGYGDKVPKTAPGRMIGLVWMFSGLFIIASFTAAVTSALTVTQLRSRISGPADLARVRVASVKDSTSTRYLHDRRIRYRGYDDVQAAVDALEAGKCDAVLYDAPILRYLVHQQHPDTIRVLDPVFDRQDYAIALPPDSRLREIVNRAVLRATSSPQWEEALTDLLGESPAN